MSLTATLQQACISPAIPVPMRRRLLSVNGVMSLTDWDEDQVLAAVEDGRLTWAFNIGLSSRAKELRILPEAVDYAVGGWKFERSAEEVLALLIPTPHAPEMATREVCRVLNCGASHVLALIAAGELKSNGRRWHTGPNGSARIETASLISFLRRRRFPVPEG